MIEGKPSCSQERLKYLMDHFQINQTELSKRTGVGRSAIANYISGLREPKQKALYDLCKPFNVDPVWLMGFDVPMFRSEFADALDVIKEREEDKELLNAYHRADDITKEMVRRILGM